MPKRPLVAAHFPKMGVAVLGLPSLNLGGLPSRRRVDGILRLHLDVRLGIEELRLEIATSH